MSTDVEARSLHFAGWCIQYIPCVLRLRKAFVIWLQESGKRRPSGNCIPSSQCLLVRKLEQAAHVTVFELVIHNSLGVVLQVSMYICTWSIERQASHNHAKHISKSLLVLDFGTDN